MKKRGTTNAGDCTYLLAPQPSSADIEALGPRRARALLDSSQCRRRNWPFRYGRRRSMGPCSDDLMFECRSHYCDLRCPICLCTRLSASPYLRSNNRGGRQKVGSTATRREERHVREDGGDPRRRHGVSTAGARGPERRLPRAPPRERLDASEFAVTASQSRGVDATRVVVWSQAERVHLCPAQTPP